MLVKNHFYQFDSYFSNKFCNEAIDYIDKTKLNKGRVGNNNLNIKTRDSDIVFLDENWLNKEIKYLIFLLKKVFTCNLNSKKSNLPISIRIYLFLLLLLNQFCFC